MKLNKKDAELDALLKSETQKVIQRAVSSLPEESLSLTWRSDLNERLRQVQPISRWRARMAAAWKPALGLALASCLALMLTVRTAPVRSQQSGDLEASMVSVYEDSTTSDELTDSGLKYHEVNDTTKTSATSSDWTESDLNSL